MAKKIKTETFTLADAISVAYSTLQELRDEVREVVDNAPEGLQESQRIQTLSETADALDNSADDEPTIEDAEIAALEVTVMPLPRRASRGGRRDYATGLLSEVIGALTNKHEELTNALDEEREDATASAEEIQARVDAIEEALDTLENAMNDADGCEFPGMFG